MIVINHIPKKVVARQYSKNRITLMMDAVVVVVAQVLYQVFATYTSLFETDNKTKSM